MPLAWFPVWLGMILATSQNQGKAVPKPPMPVTQDGHKIFEGFLDVWAQSCTYDEETKTYTFADGVVAKFGIETVQADLLVVQFENRTAKATGHVRFDDPDGNLTADSLSYDWTPGKIHGTAENFVAHLVNVTIRAARAEITQDKYELFDVSGTSCRLDPPLFALKTRHLTLYPESYGKAERPSIDFFGHRLLSIPDRTFNLNPRTEGFNPPSVSYRRGNGFGVSFRSGFLLSGKTDLVTTYSSYPGALPSYGVVYTQSLLPAEKIAHIVTPRSELSERFSFGYLENILVEHPEDEASFLHRTRKSFGFDSLWNQSSTGRSDPAHYTKPAEGVFETGGLLGTIGYYGQARLQTIRRNDEATNTRLVLAGSAGLPSRTIGPHLSTLARVDSSLFVGPNYGWARGIAGVVYRPVTQVTLSTGGYVSQDFGQSQYAIDPLYSKNGLVFRGDLNLGPTKISYMTKWDHALGWFDREYTASQVVGCLEPFVVYRQNPNTYNIGLRFRLDEFYDLLRRRDFRRQGGPPKTISPLPNGKP